MRYVSIIFFVIVFSSCSSQKEKRLLSPDNLESWTFTVDENTDSIFKTPKGALLKIDKGTFDRKVKLEVKEAYTMRDILLGGLSTTSNGRPLSSGGMIYLNAEDEEPLQFLKPVAVALPTAFVNTEMQVFKGEINGDTINWVDPDSLPNNRITRMIEQGRQLFQLNCRQCHGLYTNGTGPGLAGFRKRGPWASNIELRKWVHNPARYAATSEYAKDLVQKFGTIMLAFPALPDSLIDAVAFYIENEENNIIADLQLGDEGVCRDTVSVPGDERVISTPELSEQIFEEDSDSLPIIRGGAYMFNIFSAGWYNVDILVEKIPGSVPCEIKVKPDNNDSNLTVNLLIPSLKICIPGTYENGVYVFNRVYSQNEFVPGTEGVIVAITNESETFYHGLTSFSMSPALTVNLHLRKGKKDDFIRSLKEKKLDRLANELTEEDPEEQSGEVFEEAFVAIDGDMRRDSTIIIKRPCRAVADSIGAFDYYNH